MKQPNYQLVFSDQIITPTKGSVTFTIPSPHPLINQPLSWGIIELGWNSPTLIEPFLQDLKTFITQSIKDTPQINPETIALLFDKITTRFQDWQVKVGLIFPYPNNQFAVFISNNTNAYLLINNHLTSIPHPPSQITHFIYDLNKNNPLCITPDPLPTSLSIANLKEFVKTLKQNHHPFLFIVPKKPPKLPALPKISTKTLTSLFLITILISGAALFSYKQSQTNPSPPLIQPQNPQAAQIQNLLTQLQTQANQDPLAALRILDQLEKQIQSAQINDPTVTQTIQNIKHQLQVTSQYPTIPLVYNNQTLTPKTLIYFNNQILILTSNNLFTLVPAPNSKPQPLSQPLPTPPFIDLAVSGKDLFILTPKGVFWLKNNSQTTQIASLPETTTPAKLAFYAGNLYILTLNGQVYKLNNWITNYPNTPKLYFSDPEITTAKKIIPHKKIYILTQTGQLKTFYFGKPYSFKLEPQITPITDLYFDTNTSLFFFVNTKGFGSFDFFGKLTSWTKHPNNYKLITKTSTHLIFYQNPNLTLVPYEK